MSPAYLPHPEMSSAGPSSNASPLSPREITMLLSSRQSMFSKTRSTSPTLPPLMSPFSMPTPSTGLRPDLVAQMNAMEEQAARPDAQLEQSESSQCLSPNSAAVLLALSLMVIRRGNDSESLPRRNLWDSSSAPRMPEPLSMPHPQTADAFTHTPQTDEDGAPPGGSMHTSTPDGHSPLKLLEPFIRLKAALHENDRSIPPSLEASIQIAKISEEDPLPLLENAYAALQFLLTHRWEDQVVDEFVMSMRASPHWPAALADATDPASVEYVWDLVKDLLCIFNIKDHLRDSSPPLRTFHDLVLRLFPEVPDNIAPTSFQWPRWGSCIKPPATSPERFTLSVRELLEEGFVIQPAADMIDHLRMTGSVIQMVAIECSYLMPLLNFRENRAAQAIGIANLGNEVLQSYASLTAQEFQENFKLPIQLGIFKLGASAEDANFDLTLIASVLRITRNNHDGYDQRPHLLACRVMKIESALRTRRRWYMRLRRDIHKRKKEEPWIFWGAVFALFFGICTVIQTVASVWAVVA